MERNGSRVIKSRSFKLFPRLDLPENRRRSRSHQDPVSSPKNVFLSLFFFRKFKTTVEKQYPPLNELMIWLECGQSLALYPRESAPHRCPRQIERQRFLPGTSAFVPPARCGNTYVSPLGGALSHIHNYRSANTLRSKQETKCQKKSIIHLIFRAVHTRS